MWSKTTDPATLVPTIGFASLAAAHLTKALAPKGPNRCLCGRCRGTGFDSFAPDRAARKCPRCRGQGSTQVGNTKR
jgi:ribosomal protein S27AE